jgi:hypothetical protein
MTSKTLLTDMPIDIDTFTEASTEELSGITNAEKVTQFLYQNRGTGVKKTSISTVLRRLEEREFVQHKGDYWALGDEERVRDAYRFHQAMDDLDERFGAEDIDEWREHAVEDAGE